MNDATRSDGLPVTVTVHWPRPHLCVVQLGGELDIATVPPLVQYLRQETATGCAHLVLDVAGVRFLAAAGIRLILSAMRNDDGIRGRLHLVGVTGNKMVARVLDLTGLMPLLDVHDSIEQLLDHPDHG
jgi:anti-sigma B factor antagonist